MVGKSGTLPFATALLLAILLARAAPRTVRAETEHSAPTVREAKDLLVSAGFPHLANYNGYADSWQVPFFSAYGLIVAKRNAPIAKLKSVGRGPRALLYERAEQTDPCCTQSLYGLSARDIPAAWWLTAAGSTLARSVDAGATWLPVVDPHPFAGCQDVLIGAETVHVWSVQGHYLHVLRGYNSRATAHAAGERLAPHYSYRVDQSNCILSGPHKNLRPWSLNMSSLCPRVGGMTWDDFLAARIADLVKAGGWDGVFYDNLNDLAFSPLVDVDNDNHPDGGIVDGVNVWREGERHLLARTRQLLPGGLILVNGDLQTGSLADGREMEGFRTSPGLVLAAGIDRYLQDNRSGLALDIVNPDTVDATTPDHADAQLTIAVGALGDGFSAYDRGWQHHGTPWWFDESSGGAGSALMTPIGPAQHLLPVWHPERFAPGDRVLLDEESALVRAVTPTGLLADRGVDRTRAVWHSAGTLVSTLAQRRRGAGYLGSPAGAARLIPLGDWSSEEMPLMVTDIATSAPTTVPIDARSGITPTTRRTTYDPYAAGLRVDVPPSPSPRTLLLDIQAARQEEIWVRDADISVPLFVGPRRHTVALPVAAHGPLVVGLGQAEGAVRLFGIRVLDQQNFVLARRFARGMVLVNPTDVPHYVHLSRPYLLVAGDQSPGLSRRGAACSALVRPHGALILSGPSPEEGRCPGGVGNNL